MMSIIITIKNASFFETYIFILIMHFDGQSDKGIFVFCFAPQHNGTSINQLLRTAEYNCLQELDMC